MMIASKISAKKWVDVRKPLAILAAASFAALGVLGSNVAASADPFPVKPVTIVVPFGPGGPNDVIARISGDELSKMWKQPVIVENRAGAGGLIGATYVSQRQPDGYSMFIATNVLTFPIFTKDMTVKPKEDITPITILVGGPLLLAGSTSAPGKNVKELMTFAKANPGKLNAGVLSMTLNHLDSVYFFQKIAGTNVTIIPYNSATASQQAMVAGQVDMVLTTVQNAKALIQAGKLVGLGLAADKRAPELPDVPTFREQGYPFETGYWLGMYGPKALPAELAARLAGDYAKVFDLPVIKERVASLGMNLMVSGPVEMKRRMEEEEKRYLEAAKLVDIK